MIAYLYSVVTCCSKMQGSAQAGGLAKNNLEDLEGGMSRMEIGVDNIHIEPVVPAASSSDAYSSSNGSHSSNKDYRMQVNLEVEDTFDDWDNSNAPHHHQQQRQQQQQQQQQQVQADDDDFEDPATARKPTTASKYFSSTYKAKAKRPAPPSSGSGSNSGNQNSMPPLLDDSSLFSDMA